MKALGAAVAALVAAAAAYCAVYGVPAGRNVESAFVDGAEVTSGERIFRGARPVAVLDAAIAGAEDMAERVVEGRVPVVIKGSPAASWPAVGKWTPQYLWERQTEPMAMHVSQRPLVRMHTAVNPLGRVENVTWTRPWHEETLTVEEMFTSGKYAYFFAGVDALAPSLRSDVGATGFLTMPWRLIWETNVWMGAPSVGTSLHYDLLHNFYVQVAGKKRFIIFSPQDWRSLYLYPRIHPANRQSQVVLDAVDLDEFPAFAKATAWEVVLEPGDVLYLPPFWFHYVQSVTESVSVSVHTESEAVRVRDALMEFTLPIEGGWTLQQKMTALTHYIDAIFGGHAERRRKFIRELLETRYDHLAADREVMGLTEARAAAQKQFVYEDLEVPAAMLEKFRELAGRLDGVISELHALHEREIELANYVEDMVASALGAAVAEPFLRQMLRV